ncbi:hypothetical protein EDD11_000919 [Mortierella claussenii]|nr:hypothetical protein EDD11_000919 [Mortierella claussenii]
MRADSTSEKAKATLWELAKMNFILTGGTKLLGKEVKISSKLTIKLLYGSKLTRREQRQVTAARKFIKVRLDMAKFLQDTIEQTTGGLPGSERAQAAKDFAEFIQKVENIG